MAQRNTAELWDGVWARGGAGLDRDLYAVAKEERLIRWQRIEALIRGRFGGFDGLRVIEIGAGRGTNAALMARRGARVAVLDYSERALERSRALFDRLELPAEFIRQDALDLPDGLLGQYDVSMSFGLAEHFLGAKRTGILRAHFDLLRDGGIAIVSVPNKHNPPYRLYKWIAEHTGRWTIGEEYPFSRAELEDYCRAAGIAEYGFFGDSLWRSKKFLNPLKWFPRRKKRRTAADHAPAAGGGASATDAPAARHARHRRRRLPRRESGTRLDARYSYALVLWAAKVQADSRRRSSEVTLEASAAK